jgi:hypothetical protein
MIEPWHGGPKDKHMVSCDDEQCYVNPQTTGATKRQAVIRWNRREPLPHPIRKEDRLPELPEIGLAPWARR